MGGYEKRKSGIDDLRGREGERGGGVGARQGVGVVTYMVVANSVMVGFFVCL